MEKKKVTEYKEPAGEMLPKEKSGISLPVKIGYVAAAAALSVILMYVPQFIQIYYTDVIGISATTIATILLVTKLVDGISDILMGAIVDRTKTRIGKARPWILAGGIGSGISLFLLFCVPDGLGTTGIIVFCTATYFLTCPFFGTILSVAEGAIIPMISDKEKGRTVLGLIHSFVLIIITILVSVVTPVIVSAMGESKATYTAVTAVYAVLTVVAAIVGTVMLRENRRLNAEGEKKTETKIPLKTTVTHLIKNKYFILFALGAIFYNVALVPGASNYYAKYIFGDLSYASVFVLCSGVSYVLLFFVGKIRKLCKLRTLFTIGFLIMAAGSILTFFAYDSLILVIISMVMRGVGALPFLAYAAPLNGYICDYTLSKTGFNMDGSVYSGFSMGGKIGTGLGSAAVGWVIGLMGYVGTETVQTASAIMGIRLVNSVVPLIFSLLAALCFSQIKVEDEIPEIQKNIKERGLRA